MSEVKITNENKPVMLKTGTDLPYLVRGANWHWAFQLMEDDNVTPINTTGYTCTITIYESENGEIYTTLTNGSGVTMTAANGLFNVDIDDSAVDAYPFKTAKFKVIMTDDLGDKDPLFLGKLEFAG